MMKGTGRKIDERKREGKSMKGKKKRHLIRDNLLRF